MTDASLFEYQNGNKPIIDYCLYQHKCLLSSFSLLLETSPRGVSGSTETSPAALAGNHRRPSADHQNQRLSSLETLGPSASSDSPVQYHLAGSPSALCENEGRRPASFVCSMGGTSADFI